MNLPFKISQREKKFVMIGGVVAILIILYHVGTWLMDVRASQKEYIQAKIMTLQKQLDRMSEKGDLEGEFEILSADLQGLEKGLLSGEKAPVVAADIQRILKEMASSVNIEIKTERALNPEDLGLYLGIPVEIGFTSTTSQLKQMLYKIRASAFLLRVSEIKIRITNIKRPVNFYVTVVVKGIMKKV